MYLYGNEFREVVDKDAYFCITGKKYENHRYTYTVVRNQMVHSEGPGVMYDGALWRADIEHPAWYKDRTVCEFAIDGIFCEFREVRHLDIEYLADGEAEARAVFNASNKHLTLNKMYRRMGKAMLRLQMEVQKRIQRVLREDKNPFVPPTFVPAISVSDWTK